MGQPAAQSVQRNEMERTMSVLLCAECGFEIKPPLGKEFNCTDGKTYCAACFVDRSMYGMQPQTKLNCVATTGCQINLETKH